ncbi:MAG: VCBS domain-containing protein, partial [Roseicyclus sp.]|nr:VCBS domain-containing protein [Roseicyclus sp.]
MDLKGKQGRAAAKVSGTRQNAPSGKASDHIASFVILEPRIILDAAGVATAFDVIDAEAGIDADRAETDNHEAAPSLVEDLRDAISALAGADAGAGALGPAMQTLDSEAVASEVALADTGSEHFFRLSGADLDEMPQLADAMADAARNVVDHLGGEDGLDRLYQSFPGATPERTAEWDAAAQGVLDDILAGTLEVRVELRASDELLGAYGAFAASGPDGEPIIYLNKAWVPHLSQDQLAALIVEETGHWIDHALNGDQDTRGDEGEAFASRVFGRPLGDDAWSRIADERDTVRVEIDGALVQLEFAALLFSDEAYFVQASSSVSTSELETSAVYTTALVGESNSRYLFVSDPPEDPIFSGNNTQGYLYVVDASNQVGESYHGEVTRLFKDGSAVIGLQFFVYPDGYVAGSGDRQTSSDTSILIDLGANFALNQTYKTSSDPVSDALNALLATGGAPTAVADTDAIQLPDCSGTVTANQTATGNVLSGAGSDGNAAGADTDPDTSYVVTLTDPLPSEPPYGSFTEVQEGLTVTSATSSATGASAAVFAGATSSVAGAYGTLTIGSDGSYSYAVDATAPDLRALPSGQSLSEVFTYTISDTSGGTSSTTLTLTINGGNEAPAAANDYQLVEEGTESPGTALLAATTASGGLLVNDRDPDTGDTLKITRAEAATSLTDETFETPTVVPEGGGDPISRQVALTYSQFITTSAWPTADVGAAVFVSRDGGATFVDTGLTVVSAPKGNDRLLELDGHLDFVSGTQFRFGSSTNVNEGSSSVAASASTTKFALRGEGALPAVGSVASGDGIAANTRVVAASELTFGSTTYDFVTLDQAATVSATDSATALDPGDTLGFASDGAIRVDGTYGYLNLKSDGSYTYVLSADVPDNQLVDDYFTYEITDSNGCTDTAVLHVQLQGNQASPPDAVADLDLVVETGVAPGDSPISGSVLANDSTGTGPLKVTGVWTAADTSAVQAVSDGTTSATGSDLVGDYGTLKIGADGSYTYTLDNADPDVDALPTGAQLTETFHYRVADGKDPSEASISTLVITIEGANDAPVAVNDTAAAIEKGGLNNATGGLDPVGNLLPNDSDVDAGTTLAVSRAQAGASVTDSAMPVTSGGVPLAGTYGTLTIKADGSFGYAVDNAQPAVDALMSGQSLTEAFAYEVQDGDGATATAVLTITIYGADDVVAVNSITVNEASTHAVFTVSGGAGQSVTLSLATTGDGQGDAARPEDFGPGLEYFDGTDWIAYQADTQVALDDSGTLLVRTAVAQDDVYEGQEAFLLNVTTLDGTMSTGTGVIFDDGTGAVFNDDGIADSEATPDDDRPVFSISPVTVSEGGKAFFTVTRTGASEVAQTVKGSTSVETGDTAEAGDFSSVTNQTLSFAAGVTTQTFFVQTGADTTYEGLETFTVTLSDATGGAQISTT